MIYPHKPATAAKREAAGPAFKKIIEDYQVDMVAVETERQVVNLNCLWQSN